MPAVVLAVGAAAAASATSAAVAGAIGAGIISGVAGAFAAVGVALVGSAILPKPKAPDLNASLSNRTVNVRQPITSQKLIYGQVRVGGPITFIASSANNLHLYLIVTLAGHECAEIGDIYFNDEVVPLTASGEGYVPASGRFAGLVYIEKHLGAADQAASSYLVGQNLGWTTEHRGRGICYLLVQLDWDPNVFGPIGIPTITAVVKGKKVFDPRTGLTAWSDNPALCFIDWVCYKKFGMGAVYANEIDETVLIAAANACDEAVSLAAGGTETRYTCNGLVDAQDARSDTIDQMRSSAGAYVVYSAGKWGVFPAVWRAPTLSSITESDFRGPIRVQSRLSRRDVFNSVKGTFVDPNSSWQPTDYPAVTNAAYVTEDGGDKVWAERNLPFTTSATMAQRLAKIELERVRRQISVTAPLKLTAFRVGVPEVVPVDFTRFGWSGKSFETRNFQLSIATDDNGAPTLGVDLTLRETDANVFAWDSNEEQPLPAAPATNLPNPFAIGIPSGFDAASGTGELFVAGDGTVVSRIHATWDADPDHLIEHYEFGWRRQPDTAWQSLNLPATAVEAYVSPASDGAFYDLRLRAFNVQGVASDYAMVTAHKVVGKTAAPAAPTGFRFSALADGTRRFSWSPVSDADVRAGGGYKIRYLGGATSDWNAMTALHEGILVASPYETNELSAGTYTFALKAVDSSGNESATAVFIANAALPNPRLANAAFAQDERAAGFPGTIVNGARAGDGTLVGTSQISSLPATISGLAATIRDMGTALAGTIEYTTETFDLGLDQTFTPIVSATGSGSPTVTMQTGTSADGAPTGSFVPTGRVTARYARIKVSMPGTHPYIDGMTVIFDAPSATEVFEDLDTTTFTATYFSRIAAGHFLVATRGLLAAISTARIVAIQNVGPGWSWALISKTQTIGSSPAAEFKLYDGTGTLADATVDIELKGPKT